MFNPIAKIREQIYQSEKLRREHKLIAEATARLETEQRIRVETINWLSDNGMLRDGVR